MAKFSIYLNRRVFVMDKIRLQLRIQRYIVRCDFDKETDSFRCKTWTSFSEPLCHCGSVENIYQPFFFSSVRIIMSKEQRY